MRKELLVLLMIIFSTTLLSAEGQKDNDSDEYYRHGPGWGMMGDYFEDSETLSLKGNLVLVNGEVPVIESEGVKYYIMAPLNNIQDLNLKNNMEITVEGYEMPGPPLQWDSKEKSIMVTKAIIDGEEIEVDYSGGGYSAGGFGNMMGYGRGGKNFNRGGWGCW